MQGKEEFKTQIDHKGYFIVKQIKIDEKEDFYTSFDLSDKKEILRFFNDNGFVVIRNVLDDESCDETLNEFWDSPGLDRHDPNTWDEFWSQQRFSKFAIIGKTAEITRMQLANRQNPRVHEAFSLIYGQKELPEVILSSPDKNLWVDHDRLGVMRPTVKVEYPVGDYKFLSGDDKITSGKMTLKDKPEWKTIDKWLHLDCNPFTGKTNIGSFKTSNSDTFIDFTKNLFCQGLIALTDARLEDGGFQCVPGSFKNYQDYKDMDQDPANIQVPKDHPIRSQIQKIPVRKGSLIIWNTLTLHANYPNNSSNFRAVQYIRMLPKNNGVYEPMFPDISVYPPFFEVSELGKSVFGFL